MAWPVKYLEVSNGQKYLGIDQIIFGHHNLESTEKYVFVRKGVKS